MNAKVDLLDDDDEEDESPDPKVDEALDFLHRKMENQPVDTVIKYVNTRINWNKVKHGIKDKGDEFDPDRM